MGPKAVLDAATMKTPSTHLRETEPSFLDWPTCSLVIDRLNYRGSSMTELMCNMKEMGGSGAIRGNIYDLGICLDGMKKTTKNLHHDKVSGPI